MGRGLILGLCFFLAVLFTGDALAADKGPVETVLDGCQKEFETYCKNVTPGEGRLLACLFAYEDKLSPRCEYSLYDAAAQLERAVTALTYVANECKDDLKAYCSAIQPGEGRLLTCLDKQQSKISKRCSQALKDVG
ncbi:MAG TPA: cysteine rich repeat-containing protein, partial [Syntrophorhabdales bacterium]|nr:cysteine rich repeat-containing protein [Syntrophorhabdales bacterium]